MTHMSKSTAKPAAAKETPAPDQFAGDVGTLAVTDPDTLPCGVDCRWGCEPARDFDCRRGAADDAMLPIMEWVEATGNATGAHVTWGADFRGGTISATMASVAGGAYTDQGVEQNFDLTVAGAAGSNHYVTVYIVTSEGNAPNAMTAYFTKTA